MTTIISVILYGTFIILASYFATQNTTGITIHIASYTFKNIPLYLIILVSFFTGLIFSWIIFAIKAISFSLRIHDKENLLKEIKKKNAEIIKQTHQLELENTALKTKYNAQDSDEKSLT